MCTQPMPFISLHAFLCFSFILSLVIYIEKFTEILINNNIVQRNQSVMDNDEFTSNTAYMAIKFHWTGSMLKIEDDKYTCLNANKYVT
jgi:hypothetical protein